MTVDRRVLVAPLLPPGTKVRLPNLPRPIGSALTGVPYIDIGWGASPCMVMDARVHGAVLADPFGERHDDSLWSAHVGHTPGILVLTDAPYEPVTVHE